MGNFSYFLVNIINIFHIFLVLEQKYENIIFFGTSIFSLEAEFLTITEIFLQPQNCHVKNFHISCICNTFNLLNCHHSFIYEYFHEMLISF